MTKSNELAYRLESKYHLMLSKNSLKFTQFTKTTSTAAITKRLTAKIRTTLRKTTTDTVKTSATKTAAPKQTALYIQIYIYIWLSADVCHTQHNSCKVT